MVHQAGARLSGITVAKAIFGSAYDAYDQVVYIDDRPYLVTGVLSEMGTVASGISPDSSIFIPYETGIKYITGSSISSTITVIADEVNKVDQVSANVEIVLADILLEFLLEASCISLIGAIIGVLLALGITPLVELFSVRVELSVGGALLSLVFGVVTGSVFGFYPAYKASRLIPVVALNQD